MMARSSESRASGRADGGWLAGRGCVAGHAAGGAQGWVGVVEDANLGGVGEAVAAGEVGAAVGDSDAPAEGVGELDDGLGVVAGAEYGDGWGWGEVLDEVGGGVCGVGLL
jgi:hypothetical protein